MTPCGPARGIGNLRTYSPLERRGQEPVLEVECVGDNWGGFSDKLLNFVELTVCGKNKTLTSCTGKTVGKNSWGRRVYSPHLVTLCQHKDMYGKSH